MLTLINLPIVVWMLYTYFREIPGEILEAARMDGATLWGEIVYVLTPMAVPGIASTMLLNIILAWNEAFWSIRLTSQRRAADGLHQPRSPARRACSGPSFRQPRRWPSRRSSSWAGSRSASWCAA
jgi:ABC-type glycerol-3-phosphate transport system permease component